MPSTIYYDTAFSEKFPFPNISNPFKVNPS